MRTITTIALFTLRLTVVAQTVVTGTVSDRSGPVPGANVMIMGTYDGATTDVNGAFSFSTDEAGDAVVVISYIGYKTHQQGVTLEGGTLTLSVELKEAINELNAVTISAGAFNARDEARRTVLRAVDVATTAGATADIAGALNTLPGTQKVGESGRLFVRGGDGSEVKTFVDGLLVLDAYSPSAPNTPSRGRFLPFMFKGISFSTGGYSAEYGQALSSALALDSRDEATTTRTDIGLLSVGGDITHVQAWEKGSGAAKIQYTNLNPYVGWVTQELDWELAPVSVEGIGVCRQRFGKSGMVKAYANVNRSDFSLNLYDINDPDRATLYRLINDYTYLNGFARAAINDRWIVRGGISYTDIRNDNRLGGNRVIRDEEGLHAKVVFDGALSEHVELRTGAEVVARTFTLNGDLPSAFDEDVAALFVEADLYTTSKFLTRAGVRTEYNSLNDQVSVDPRLSVAYKMGENSQVSMAFGTFRQSAPDDFLLRSSTLSPERATHVILNYQRTINEKTFRVETYYKQYDDLIRYGESFVDNSGDGYARGIDLFWRDNGLVPNLDYWLSYTFVDSERFYRYYPERATPSFVSRHNFAAVAKYFFSKMKTQLGATFSYASSRPYDDPNGAAFSEGRTPVFMDLSVNLAYLPMSWLIVYASCTNLTGRDNVFGYEFSRQPNESGQHNRLPIRQPAPRFLFLGVFITLSKDKSLNQLPTL